MRVRTGNIRFLAAALAAAAIILPASAGPLQCQGGPVTYMAVTLAHDPPSMDCAVTVKNCLSKDMALYLKVTVTSPSGSVTQLYNSTLTVPKRKEMGMHFYYEPPAPVEAGCYIINVQANSPAANIYRVYAHQACWVGQDIQWPIEEPPPPEAPSADGVN